jgi:hypothetical protein
MGRITKEVDDNCHIVLSWLVGCDVLRRMKLFEHRQTVFHTRASGRPNAWTSPASTETHTPSESYSGGFKSTARPQSTLPFTSMSPHKQNIRLPMSAPCGKSAAHTLQLLCLVAVLRSPYPHMNHSQDGMHQMQ